MGENSHIQWTDHTINLWWGCTKVSEGCAHCYADSLAHRFGKDIWGAGKPREDHRASATKLALRLNKQAAKEGRRFRIFSASMSDWLDEEVPIEWLADLLALIHETPGLDWLLLTKRPENFFTRLQSAFIQITHGESKTHEEAGVHEWIYAWAKQAKAPRNLWIGTTVENQRRANERIPKLLQIPARVRFLSCEPLLEAVTLPTCTQDVRCPFNGIEGHSERPLGGIDWVICGGESGGKARPMADDWARGLRFQCEDAGVAFFMKQLGGVRDARGELHQMPEDLRVRQFPSLA